MIDSISSIYAGWRDLMDNKSDPRTRDWPLMSSPFPTVALSLTYAYFVKVLGPRLMEDRKPFQLRAVLIIYNFAQVVFSIWLFYESAVTAWFAGYSYRCEPVDTSYSPKALKIAGLTWWYFFSKFTEFFDTIFFVLRKRFDQVSTLHVIHHGVMPVSVWWGVKFIPGGHGTFFGFLNIFVHIFMYTYYMLAAMGPKVQKYLWWKKYLTVLQMVQFVLIMVHSFQLFFSNECNYPMSFAYFIGGHAIMFYFLFSNFYKETYVKKDKKRKVTENGHVKQHQNGYKNGSITNGHISKLDSSDIKETEKLSANGNVVQKRNTDINEISNPDGSLRQRVNGVGSYQ
ncbi:elongation of very long chain fatty acids protein 7 [Condylostylus longicornis]|uniref:elongation of very long chain fatty acids protein 7 n=1 Tax=Condylostylus longicornis TaxID=2530218 RepID=UPI00244DE23F|nr:elongation of very long chain fatty acids protein 7 [Condylostylus longicornis]